jgi:hypothetical protein
VNIGGAIGLVLMVYHAHKIIWRLDMEQKTAQLVSKSAHLSG